MFTFHNTPTTSLELSDLTLSPLKIGNGVTKFDLSLSIANTQPGLTGWLTYRTDLFNAATITQMLEHFQTLLSDIVANPDQPISIWPFLIDTERRQMLAEWHTIHRRRPKLEAAYVAPSTEVEQAIASIWQEVLQLDKVGTNDNFFDLGGHSLLIIKVHSRLQELFGQDLSIVDMFKCPTINCLTKNLSQEKRERLSLQQQGEQIKKLQQGKNRLLLQLRQLQRATREWGRTQNE
jgi:non-ribosomal peptide synthetase component F